MCQQVHTSCDKRLRPVVAASRRAFVVLNSSRSIVTAKRSCGCPCRGVHVKSAWRRTLGCALNEGAGFSDLCFPISLGEIVYRKPFAWKLFPNGMFAVHEREKPTLSIDQEQNNEMYQHHCAV